MTRIKAAYIVLWCGRSRTQPCSVPTFMIVFPIDRSTRAFFDEKRREVSLTTLSHYDDMEVRRNLTIPLHVDDACFNDGLIDAGSWDRILTVHECINH
ncbi:hypothetical protein EDC04DRAFT_2663560 [Pisolithus marmoratus]|nr:hypothetical protein EDC04DRAFT_2663560 [Pisolithus marmoratus]